jgi:biopolymer transport protein ExbB/TolQ
MLDYITHFTIIIIAILAVLYIRKQITLSQNIRIEDTTLEKLDEKLKKHKLIGGRHKRTNKKNPPIV